MRWWRALALVALAGAPVLAAGAAPAALYWTQRKAIGLPALTAPTFVEVILDPAVYHDASPSLADLRIRDGDGGEVAYVLRRHEKPATRREREIPLLDLQQTPSREARFVLDLGDGAPIHAGVRIRLGPAARNFRVPVKVETSLDRRAWHLVRAAGFIYAVEGETRATDTSVRYPPSTARYLRVTVGPAGGRPLPVAGAAIGLDTPSSRDEEAVPAVIERQEDRAGKSTRLTFDLGGRRPVDRAELDIDERTFYRVALVEASDDRVGWRFVGSGAVSAIDTPRLRDRQTSLPIPETAARYLRLTIQNLDDRPLGIAGARLIGVRRGLVFEARPEQVFHLDYGRADAAAPRYDLQRAFPYVESERIPVARLGPATRLPPPPPPRAPWTEGRPFVLWAAMAAAGLLLAGLLFRMARQIPSSTSEG
ncbi:MAG TPA: DUF3999 family protein [Methylomirabilota bacterium]|nr:DUF3999 family protein [Methylomirabilota bacterium]